MFKPFDIYLNKKFPNKEDDEEVKKEAKNEWENLSESKKLKFIKKAEKKYDSKFEENPELPPFYTNLTLKELEILIKSYNLPEKLPVNSKLYLLKKYQDKAVQNASDPNLSLDEILKNAKTEGEKKWKEFTEEEKNKILNEYHKKFEDYNDQFFEFARNLPENRVVDYKEYISNKKKIDSINSQRTPKINKINTKNEQKDLNKKFIPFEIYFDKHRDESNTEHLFKIRNDLRVKYKNLSDKKKNRLLKKAEQNYDAHYANETLPHRLFSSYLKKDELKTLFTLYGMPERVPNLSAYYLRMKMKEGMNSMKDIYDSFRKLTSEEKVELYGKHQKDYEKFSIKQKEFLDNLPPSRLEDYNNYINSKKSKKQSNEAMSSGSPTKKIKLEEESNGVHVKDELRDESSD